ncbi:uncharacterized protein LOC127873438 isoform X2 [Dreissena polymorpha]|uniref:uncharacterized protein LOC127873438 isoform X2 n=1 Tax=Dreissena polymorpha TaxID=45954 RepID=UPI00226414A0|nr:uncharacterized protein LOC127873438 isoform X2 [Dreissena polymorpha]
MLVMGLVQHANFKLGILLLCQALHLTAEGHALGYLSTMAPTFIGRNITFQLKPTSPLSYEQYEVCKWKVLFKQSSKVYSINSGYSLFESDGMKMMELDSDYVNSSWDGAAINVKCNDQESTVIKLKLEDFKNECGYLNVLSYPEGPGGYGQIAYFPTAKILRNPVGYARIWERNGVDITYLEGVYEERNEKLNFQYILSVFNFTGLHRYNVMCKELNTETNEIILFDGRPVLSSLCSVDNCSNCLCVIPGDRLICTTYSNNVSLLIGHIKLQLKGTKHDNLFTYTNMNYTISEKDHQSTVVCSASYDNKNVFTANASVYIYVPPKLEPELTLPELQEGSPVNITCVTPPGRPPPVIQMFLDSKIINHVSQYNVYDATNKTYTSVATLKSANRTWDNKNITCRYLVTYPDGQNDSWRSTTKTAKYTYPLSNPANMSAGYHIYIECPLVDINTKCIYKWATDKDNIQTLDALLPNMTGTVFALNVNVSDEAEHIKAYLVTKCDLSTEVCFPCSVKRNPLANISLGKLEDQIYRHACLNRIECTIVISRSDIEAASKHECKAWNINGLSNTTLESITELEEDRLPLTEGSIPLMSIMIGLVVFAVVISTVTVFFFIRGVRRRIRRNAILDPKGFRINSSQQSDIRMESEHQSGNDSVHASNTETNANFEANINIYSNVVASFSRPVAQTAEQNELVYADIDIAFLELKQKKVTKKNKYVPTEYTSVRELTADVSDEHVYVNT